MFNHAKCINNQFKPHIINLNPQRIDFCIVFNLIFVILKFYYIRIIK